MSVQDQNAATWRLWERCLPLVCFWYFTVKYEANTHLQDEAEGDSCTADAHGSKAPDHEGPPTQLLDGETLQEDVGASGGDTAQREEHPSAGLDDILPVTAAFLRYSFRARETVVACV